MIFPFLYHVTKSEIEESDFDDLAAPQGGGSAWGVMKKKRDEGASIFPKLTRKVDKLYQKIEVSRHGTETYAKKARSR